MDNEITPLTFDGRIYVNVKTYGWVEPIRRQGPLPGLLLPIYSVIDLLNQNYKVEIPQRLWDSIYNLILIFNKDAEINGSEKVLVAQKTMEDLINREKNKVLQEVNKKIEKVNPFVKSTRLKELERRESFNKNIFKRNIPRELKDQINKSQDKYQSVPNTYDKDSVYERALKDSQRVRSFDVEKIPDLELDLSDFEDQT